MGDRAADKQETGDTAGEAIQLGERSMSAVGRVVFMRSEERESKCRCCPDGRHVFCRAIDFGGQPSPVWKNGAVSSLRELEIEALYHVPGIEGRRVRVTIEIVD